MAWFFACFKQRKRTKRYRAAKLQKDDINSVPSLRASYAVSVAACPDDLYKVRQSAPDFPFSTSRETEPKSSSSPLYSPFVAQPANHGSEKVFYAENDDSGTKKFQSNEANISFCKQPCYPWSEVNLLEEELENLRRKLAIEADAAKNLSDEVKYLRACHELLESPDTFRVTLEKLNSDNGSQSGFNQSPWLLSSVLTKIQPNQISVDDKSSRTGSPFNCLSQKCQKACEDRGVSHLQATGSWSVGARHEPKESVDLLINKCHTSTKDPSWLQTEMKTNAGHWKSINSCETYEDLLLEHIDVSSLITDSELVTNWERSFGKTNEEDNSKLSQPLEHTDQSHPGFSCDGNKGRDMEGIRSRSRLPKKQKTSSAKVAKFASQCSLKMNDSSSLATGSLGVLKDTDLNLHQAPKRELVSSSDDSVVDTEAEEPSHARTSSANFKWELWSDSEVMDENSNNNTRNSPQYKLLEGSMTSDGRNCFEMVASMGSGVHEGCLTQECQRTSIHVPVKQEICEDDDDQFSDALSQLSAECNDKQSPSHIESLPMVVQVGDTSLHADSTSFKPLAQAQTLNVAHKDETTLTPLDEDVSMADITPELQFNLFNGGGASDGSQTPVIEASQTNLNALGSMPVGTTSHLLGEELGSSNLLKSQDELSYGDISIGGLHKNEPTLATNASYLSPQHQSSVKRMVSQQSPAKFADDRPILGTVAAHWSPIATRKWWDGKGIPNSTSKYKEDQIVNWHAVPFEVRLEQALACSSKLG